MALRVGTAYLDIEPKLGLSWQRDIDRQTDGAAGRMESRFGSAFKRIGLALGGVFAAKLGVDFGRELLDLGNQTEVFRQKARTVFEAQNADVSRWAKANASAFGLTDDKLSGLAANFGDLLKPMGFTATQAADMSTKVVGLAGALSAWTGGQRSAAEVSETLSKAMLGEREELKGLGISISQADVDARLAAKGQKELTGAALQQVSAIATQELIFEKSTDAQKAWADGSLDAIKKQNALRERIGELKEDLAGKLRPAFASVVGFIVDRFIPGMDRARLAVTPIIKAIVGGVTVIARAFKVLGEGDAQGFGEIMDNLLGNSGRYVGFFRGLGETILQVAGFIRDNLKPILIGLGAVFLAVTSPITAVVVALGVAYAKSETFRDVVGAVAEFLTGTVMPAVSRFAGGVSDLIGDLVAYVKRIWPQVSEAIGHVVNVVSGVIRTFVDVVGALWRAWGDDIARIVARVFGAVKGTVESVLGVVRGIIQTVLALINGDWGKAWSGLGQVVSAAWGGVKEIVASAIGTVRSLIGGIGSTIAEVAKGIWDPLKAGFKAVINWIIRGWNSLEFKIPGFETPGPAPDFKGFTLGVPDIKELWRGGALRPGELAFTGERGVELLRGGTAHVFPHDELMAALGGLNQRQAPSITVHATSAHDEDLAIDVAFEMRSLMLLLDG